MSQRYDGRDENPYEGSERELQEIEELLTQGVSLQEDVQLTVDTQAAQTGTHAHLMSQQGGDDEEDTEAPLQGDLQGALALYAEAAQDMATAGLELGLGRHFACADYCNQAVEKAAQAVSLLRFGRRSAYNHDLRMLGEKVGAPVEILNAMAILTPFHPESFYAETPPEEADEVISAEQASEYVQHARSVMRWAKNVVLRA
jgi:HEPN domain-containing protein